LVAIIDPIPTAFLLGTAVVAIAAFVIQKRWGFEKRWHKWRGIPAMTAVFMFFALIAAADTKGSFDLDLFGWLIVLIPFALIELVFFWIFRRQ
jgi:putative flippase GtrA